MLALCTEYDFKIADSSIVPRVTEKPTFPINWDVNLNFEKLNMISTVCQKQRRINTLDNKKRFLKVFSHKSFIIFSQKIDRIQIYDSHWSIFENHWISKGGIRMCWLTFLACQKIDFLSGFSYHSLFHSCSPIDKCMMIYKSMHDLSIKI